MTLSLPTPHGCVLLVSRNLPAWSACLRADMHDAVRVDIERDFDLRNAARCGSDAGKLEPSQSLVVLCQFAFALQHMHFNARLSIGGR